MPKKICKNCKEEIKNPKQKLYCDVDCRIAYHKKLKKPIPLEKAIQSKAKDVERYYECICPSCGKIHRIKMYWTGGKDVTPRIRCKPCKATAKQPTYSNVEKVYQKV